MTMIRFTIGRMLIHTGLRMMPLGRVRSELYALLDQWTTHVREALKDDWLAR